MGVSSSAGQRCARCAHQQHTHTPREHRHAHTCNCIIPHTTKKQQSGAGQAVSGDDFRAAEPDTLRRCAVDLIEAWNGDRAEDVYRIVSAHLGVPLVDMAYAELLWLDRLGMYIRSEVAPGGDEGASSGGGGPQVVRVPFYRPVLDERDARSVITMAAQIAWEGERSYVPPVLMSS